MQTWDELEKECNACHACQLSANRRNMVFGCGNRVANVMFIGEGPGEQEDIQGIPFVGPAGQLLDDMLSIIDMTRENCYIANIVKCRPPGNRDPEDAEIAACIRNVETQIKLVQPKIIVCLGRVAARNIIYPDYRITKEHGTWIERKGVWMTAFYHPSALLRDPSKRPDAFGDLLSLREKMRELSIL